MKHSRKVLSTILCIAVIAVFSLTIAYAVLSKTLTISGSSAINASTWDIGMKNSEKFMSTTTGSATYTTPIVSGTTISYSAGLTKPGDSVTLYFDFTNEGTLNGELTSIVKSNPTCTSKTGSTADADLVCNNLEVTIKYSDGTNVSVGDVINENGIFKDFTNVKYFGINSDSDSKLRDQVDVLFYEDYNNHSVLLNTKQGDEVILLRASDNSFKNFDEVYKYLEIKTNEFEGEREFVKDDELTVPNIKFDVLKKYNELIGKTFNSNEGVTREISDALQTIRFEIDNEGGKIKSEAIIAVKMSAIILPREKRNFSYDDTFYLMLRENGKDKPYFMVRVDNIELFQEAAEKMN